MLFNPWLVNSCRNNLICNNLSGVWWNHSSWLWRGGSQNPLQKEKWQLLRSSGETFRARYFSRSYLTFSVWFYICICYRWIQNMSLMRPKWESCLVCTSSKREMEELSTRNSSTMLFPRVLWVFVIIFLWNNSRIIITTLRKRFTLHLWQAFRRCRAWSHRGHHCSQIHSVEFSLLC